MHCEQCETLLPLLVFDEIEDGDKTQVLEHLSHCGSCSEKLGDLRVTFNLLREGINTGPAPVLSADRRNRLLATLAMQPVRSKRKSKKAVAKKRAGIFNLFNIGTPAQRLLAIAATLAFSAALATVLLPSLGSARRTSRIVADQNAKRAEEAVAMSRADASRYDDQLATNYEPRVMELGEVPRNGRPPAENSYLQTFGRSYDHDASQRLAYTDLDRSVGSGGGGRASGRNGESQSYNSPVPPPLVRLSSRGEGVSNDVQKDIAMKVDETGDLSRSENAGARFRPGPAPTGEALAQGPGNNEMYKNQWFKSAGRTDAPAAEPTVPATPPPSSSVTTKPGGGPSLPPMLTVVPPRTENFDAPADQSHTQPSSARSRSEADTRWGYLSGAPAGPATAPAQTPSTGAAPRGSRVLHGQDPGRGPGADDQLVLPLEPRSLKREQEERLEKEVDRLERLTDERDGLTHEFRRDGGRDVQKMQGQAVLEKQMEQMKQLDDLEDEGFALRSHRERLKESRYSQEELLRSQLQAGDEKPQANESTNGTSSGKSNLGLDLSGALGGAAPPQSTTLRVRGSMTLGETMFDGIIDGGGKARQAPNFSAAPEFDLNSAVDNGKFSGGKKSEQASGTTLFGDGKGATTLFSESDEDGEQATREEKIEQITTLIQDNVGKQHTWAAYGGEVSSLREIDGKLIIKGTATQHRQTTDLLNKLRTDQAGNPLPAIKVPGETEADRALTQRLQKRVDINLEGRKLVDAVRELEEKTGGNLVVNWQALEAAGVERDMSVNLRLKEVPAETALKVMLNQAAAGAELEPIDYEVVNGIVNISTRRDLDRNTVTQVYDVRDLLNQPLNAKDSEALARQLKEAEAREKEQLAKQAEEASQNAEAARIRSLAADRERSVQVQRLLQRAMELRKTQDYDRALQLVNQALFLDEGNPAAASMKMMIEDTQIAVKSKEQMRLRNLRMAGHSTEIDESTVPYSELMTYPGDWPKITASRWDIRDGESAELNINRRVAKKLQEPLTVNYQGQKLVNVIDDLRSKTGINYFVNWSELERLGVAQDTSITLNVDKVSADQVMRLVLNQSGAGGNVASVIADVIDGVVHISSEQDIKASPEVTVYDLKSLVDNADVAADSSALQRMERDVMFRDLLSDIAEQVSQQQQQKLEGRHQTSVSELNGHLIVRATREQHQQIQAKLRNVFGKQRNAAADAVRNDDAPVNDQTQLQPATSFRVVPVNPWTLAQEDAQSTFALDVDTASYTLGRRYLERGFLPPQGSVRMEEYVNAFDYNYVNNSDQVFRIYASAAPAPFANAGEQGIKLVKIGVKGKVIGRDGRKPANLVLVVDTSGSMARPDRLPLVQHSLELLTEQLSPQDTVSLVTFGSQVMTLLDRTPASNKQQIIAAIRSLQSNGPTNLLKGVEAGYRLAITAHKAGAINRVILCSDGIATLGETEADTILGYVEKYRKQGISCTTVGVGAGAYDDDMMEKLANKGDGMYYFIDSPREAKRVFVDEITATLQTIAKDAKIQVEFDPQRVRRYRLIGYENRAVADKDFRNDTIDAGEVGSGQSSTALYEVELIGDERADLGTVYVRYRNADTNKIEEISHRLTTALVQDRSPQSDPRFFLAACAAEFAEVLRGSEHATGGNLIRVQRMLERTVPHLPLDEKAQELLNLVRKAQGLPSAP